MIHFDQTPLFCNVIAYYQTLPAPKSLKFSFLHAIYIGSLHCSVRLIICDMALKFSAISTATRRHCSSFEIKKNNAKYRQIDYLSFIFKPEVRSGSKMFVITKWTNQVLFCLVYLVHMK